MSFKVPLQGDFCSHVSLPWSILQSRSKSITILLSCYPVVATRWHKEKTKKKRDATLDAAMQLKKVHQRQHTSRVLSNRILCLLDTLFLVLPAFPLVFRSPAIPPPPLRRCVRRRKRFSAKMPQRPSSAGPEGREPLEQPLRKRAKPSPASVDRACLWFL